MPHLFLRVVLPATLLLLAGCVSGRRPTRELEVILVAGQSNAVGYDAVRSDLPPDAADQRILFWWRCGDPPPDAHDSTSGGQWASLQPQPRGEPLQTTNSGVPRQYGNFAKPEGGFGPEMGLARTLAPQDERRLAVVKVAFSGAGMRTDWNPEDPGDGGACYRALVAETHRALKAARDAGYYPKLRAMVWVQGESDANPSDSLNYARALSFMIAALRRDLASPDLRVLLGVNTRYGDGRNPFLPVIIEAQRTVAATVPRVAYVDTSGSTIINPSHWDSQGTLSAGERFAAALLQEESGPSGIR
jgi:hypothetical protein